MKTAIYARVSSEAQEKQQTIESQLAELRACAEAQRLGLPVEFVDDGYSGSMLERPGLDRLRDAVAAGEVDTILCLCPDRLARSYLYQGILLEEFEKRGARVVFLNGQVEDTPEGKLMVQIQGAVGEYERAKILDRTRRGRQHKARQGLMPGGQAPYGYDYVPGDGCRWQVNETEAAVVREVFRLLNEEGRTLTSIAQELAKRGIPTKRGGLTWGHSSVHRMLKNEAYAGTAYFFKEAPVEPQERRDDSAYRRRLKTSQRTRDRSEWIALAVPALVDRETFDRAQDRLQENARFSPRNNKRHFYPLRGLLKCGHCGRTLSGQKMNPGAYYECGGKDRLGPGAADTCRAKAVRTDRIEPVVWEAMERLVNDPAIILEQYEAEQDDREPRTTLAAETRKRVEKRLSELAAEEMQVVRLFRAGKIGEAVLDAQLAEVRREREGLEEELQAAAEAMAWGACLDDEGGCVRSFCEELRDSFIGSTGEEKQQVLRLLVDRIVVDPDGDHGQLHGTIPLPHETPVLLPHCQPRVKPWEPEHLND